MRTLLAEAENLVSGWPLTHVSVDPAVARSLTPNHFLLGESNAVICPGVLNNDMYIIKCWRTAQALADMYWRR